MLWFTKGEESRLTMIHREKDMEDFIESTPPDKDKHPWAQSPVEAEFFIRNLTLDQNALVVDPFLGSGAFGVAAAKLDRYFVGIEIDRDTFEKAKLNIAQSLTACPPKEEE
jgi:DNA modification methylase